VVAESKLTLVCPVYNEPDNIVGLLESIAEQVHTQCELMVVYDHDGDSTLPVIAANESRFRFGIRRVKNAYGNGALGAVKTGLAAATSDAVVVIMADLADDLSIVDEMFAALQCGRLDVVCGSRYMRGGRQIGGPPLKGALSRLAGLSLRYLARVPTHDATNNFKMYRRGFLQRVDIQSRAGFEIGLELVVKAHVMGFRIGEIPATWRDRVAGRSRFRLMHWLPHYLRWYLYAFRRHAQPATSHAAN